MLKRTLFFVGLILLLLSIVGFVFVSTRFPRQKFVTGVSAEYLTPQPVAIPSLLPELERFKYPFTADVLKQISPYGCSWSGLMGTVHDLDGKPLTGYNIHVQGDAKIDVTVMAGSSQFKGLPGFDESAWDVPINTSDMMTGTWRVCLYQPDTDTPLSDMYEVRLEAVCGANAALVRFVQHH